jgi:hypothetical protein
VRGGASPAAAARCRRSRHALVAPSARTTLVPTLPVAPVTTIRIFMMGVLTAQLALGEALWRRIGAYLGFGLAFGLLGALVLDPLLGVLTGHFFVVWACIGVTALAIATSVGALARLFGQAGLPLAALAFLIVGNPSAGRVGADRVPARLLPRRRAVAAAQRGCERAARQHVLRRAAASCH